LYGPILCLGILLGPGLCSCILRAPHLLLGIFSLGHFARAGLVCFCTAGPVPGILYGLGLGILYDLRLGICTAVCAGPAAVHLPLVQAYARYLWPCIFSAAQAWKTYLTDVGWWLDGISV